MIWRKNDADNALALFGGSLGTCPTSPITNAMLVLDNTTWSTVTPVAAPSSPSARVFAAGVPFGAPGTLNQSKLLIYGGSTSQGPVGDAWIVGFGSQTWELVNLTSGPSAKGQTPGLRAGHGFEGIPCYPASKDGWNPCMDSVGSGILFGGFNGSQVLADVWLLSLGAKQWHLLNSGQGAPGNPAQPGPRAHAATAVVPGIGQTALASAPMLLVFGGVGGPDAAAPNTVLSDLWSYSLSESQWLNMTGMVLPDPTHGWPSARQGSVLKVAAHPTVTTTGGKPASGTTLVLFGGADGSSTSLGDTWTLTLSDEIANSKQTQRVGAAPVGNWKKLAADPSGPAMRAYATSMTRWVQTPTGPVAQGAQIFGGVVVIPDQQYNDGFVFEA